VHTEPAEQKKLFDALRGLARKRPAGERCELCGAALAGEHHHLLELATRGITCACDPCAILFSHRGEDRRFLRIPRTVRRLDQFEISDAEWASLMLPIDMAFFVRNTSAGRTLAFYPSPAGCTESLLPLDSWDVLDRISPDVEALLVNRTRGRRDYYIAPVDQCYRLTGLIRMQWRGLSGGDEVWKAIEGFFEELSARA
jgi:hypothetical protein